MLVFLSIVIVVISALILFVLLLFIFLAIDVSLDLPYVATKRERIDTIMRLAKIKNGEVVVDLGSGDGRLLFASASKGAKAIGYEINPFLIFLTKLKSRFSPLQVRDLISVKKQNLWKADLKVADVIFVYGRKKTMEKFEDFVFSNAQKGTRVVVNTSLFPNRKPLKSQDNIFLYRV